MLEALIQLQIHFIFFTPVVGLHKERKLLSSLPYIFTDIIKKINILVYSRDPNTNHLKFEYRKHLNAKLCIVQISNGLVFKWGLRLGPMC